MHVFRSLTAKYVLVSLIILSILSVFVYASVDFTRHMAGEAATINTAGKLRFRSYQMAWNAHGFAEEAFPPEDRAQSQADIARHIQEFDQIVRGIETGNGERITKPINHYPEAVAIFGDIRKEWEHDLKPPLMKIVSLPHDVPEVAARKLLLDFDKRLPGFVNRANDLVEVLELHYDEEIRAFARQRLLIVTIFIFIAFIVALYFRKKIVIPMKLLTRSAFRLKTGDFDVQAPVQGDDEIGTLGAVFNGMATGLKEQFAEKSRKLQESDALSTISRAASESLAIDVMAARILDAILSLEPLALAKKGAIFISDSDKRTLELVVSRNFSAEQVSGCGIVKYGECLCGIAAELNENILSDNNVHDLRHTKTYSDAEEHGHIILPLQARGKLIGVVCLYLPQGMTPSAEDRRLYQSMADIIAIALQNAVNHRRVAMLAQSLDSSNDMIVITNTEGRIIHVNPEVLRELGYSLTELIGQPVSMMQSDHNPPGLGEEIFKTTLAAGGWRGEVVNSRKDGSKFPTMLTTSLVQAEDGRILALVDIARNIAGTKQADAALRASEEKYRTLIEEVNDGLFIMDARGTFTFANRALAHIHGYEKPDDLVGKSFIELTAPESREAFERDFIRNMGSGRDPGVIEVPIEKPDKSMAYIQIHPANIVEDGRVVGTRGIVRDITERITMDKMAKSYSASLEAEVAARTQEIEDINIELQVLNRELEMRRVDAEAANSAKSDFLANMSHELRTPLNSILGFSEIMRDGLAGEVNPQQKEYLNDVWESGSHLLRLINDILDISKIEAGKMELERGVTDLDQLLGETLVFFREKAARHTISLHHEVAQDLPTISADERKIKQVLINLLTNALKFTPDGGEVGVEASVEAGELRVTVWDTGIGIAPEDLGRLFQPFQQLESPLTKKHQGTGLGLSLCRKLVELHGGRIWVESTPGQGSRFTFAIPIVAAAENAEKG